MEYQLLNFLKKYFPPNDNIDYSQISQELNQAFYDNDVKSQRVKAENFEY